jgi:hypothetical protein
LANKRFVLWKWAKPSKTFNPEVSHYWEEGIRFKSHNRIVYAGLNPLDWIEYKGDSTLHKIVLDKQQAELCVVAEDDFSARAIEYAEKTHSSLIGCENRYRNKNYEGSFIPLTKYSGGYNRPEVLIPFPVKTEAVSCVKVYILIWKLKKWLTRILKKKR